MKSGKLFVVLFFASIAVVFTVLNLFLIKIYSEIIGTSRLSSLYDYNLQIPFYPKLSKYHVAGERKFQFETIFNNVTHKGLPFDTKWNVYLERMGLLDVTSTDDNKVLNSKPVMVSAVSSNHFVYFLKFMHSLVKVYKPEKMLFIYDLGLR